MRTHPSFFPSVFSLLKDDSLLFLFSHCLFVYVVRRTHMMDVRFYYIIELNLFDHNLEEKPAAAAAAAAAH